MVSIVIPCYNDKDYIEQAIDSAQSQTYPEKEIIVVNDGSDEATTSILKSSESKIDVLINQSNMGLSAARNNGIIAAKGEFILVWDADDFFDASFCEKAVEVLKNNYPRYKMVTCQAIRFSDRGPIDIFTPRGGDLANFLFANSAIGNSMFKRKDWEEAGRYDEAMIKGYEDWEFFIRLLRHSGEAYVIQEPLFNYRQKEKSLRKDANLVKYDIWHYIFMKHQSLYSVHYEGVINHFIGALKNEEKQRKKVLKSKNYIVGYIFLKPLRGIKKYISRYFFK